MSRIEIESNHSSWFPASLIFDLEDFLGCKMDVVTEAGLERVTGTDMRVVSFLMPYPVLLSFIGK